MSLEELIQTRRTIHQYTDEKVSEELVQKALSLGLWSLNHKLTFPWRWISVGASHRQRIADLAQELKFAKSTEAPSPQIIQAIRDSVTKSSHYIALSMVRSPDEGRLWEDFATVSCSVQIISLVLWQHGIGSKWTTSGYTKHDKTYDILGVDRFKEKLVGGLFIGKPALVPKSQGRPELSQFLRSI